MHLPYQELNCMHDPLYSHHNLKRQSPSRLDHKAIEKTNSHKRLKKNSKKLRACGNLRREKKVKHVEVDIFQLIQSLCYRNHLQQKHASLFFENLVIENKSRIMVYTFQIISLPGCYNIFKAKCVIVKNMK
jgi:hypothetical protein